MPQASFCLLLIVSSCVAWEGAQSVVTTEDMKMKMAAGSPPVSGHIADATWQLHIDDSSSGHQQKMTGFGAAWTDATVTVFNSLSADDQEKLLQELFSSDNGIGLGLMRHTIGQSDLTPNSIGEWSFDSNGGHADPTLANFTLTEPGDQMASWIKRMFQVKKDVTLLGSPWSPPQWMKKGKSLDLAMGEVWSMYMVQYLLAYKARGITVDAMTMQNEPLHAADSAWTMYMDQTDQTVLVPVLQAAIKAAGLSTKIWAYDHNTDKPEFPQYVIDHTSVDTVAWHCYSSSDKRWDPLTTFHYRNPNVKQYMTECWTHLSTGEGFFDLPTFIQSPIQQYASGSMAWTLGGSTKYDVGYPGGCGQCSGIVQVDMDARNYTLTEDYYKLGQFSKYVQTEAVYLNTTGSHDYRDGTGVQASAFLNPDGTRTLVIVNKIKNDLKVQAIFSSGQWSGNVLARSVTTWVLPAMTPTPPTPPLPTPPPPPTPPPLPAGCVFKKLCAASCSQPGGACSSVCTGTYAGGACSCDKAKGCGGSCQTCPECGNCCCRV
jgi:glucosylceramidase